MKLNHFLISNFNEKFRIYSKNGVGGSIHMNDVKLGNPKYAKKCSYILQDDNLYPAFTVHETMLLAANLKIADMTVDEKNLIVSL